MIFISLFVLGFAGKLSMSNRILLRESINRPSKVDLVKFSKIIIVTTITIETIGVIFLTIYWMNFFGFKEALYSAVFHSVSAFTTAGFSIYSDSFIKYQNSIPFNLIIISLIVLGSLGFFVLYDLYLYITNPVKKTRKLATHSKLVISLMLVLTLSAAGLIFYAEGSAHVNSLREKIVTSIFQAATASSTAGFNTIDIGLMKDQSLFTIITLMFIGAGSGGTAGGIKLTTFGVLLISLYSQLSGRKNVAVLKRKISESTVQRSIAIALIAVLWLIAAVLVLTFSEQKSFIQILFEVASALGTVGLSAGITGDLSIIGKIIIIITMLIGRVGPLGIGLTVLIREKITSFEYPESDILVG
jgi:trk system potassium uptake protein TrkH